MHYFKEMWAVMVTVTVAWLQRIDNNVLSIIVNLLTILIFIIGLTDWAVRRICGKRKKKQEDEKPETDHPEGRPVLEMIESTQKPFKTVQMLENPMQTGERIGNIVDNISTDLIKGGAIMKKFFKWTWYNKEQLFSIMYSVALMALSQLAIWTDAVSAFLPELSATGAVIVKASICVVSVLFTALTVRNVCVTYGLSSLDTIDKVLAKKAEAAAEKLSPEQKKVFKTYISTLQTTLAKKKAELVVAEKALAEIEALFNADNSLVQNYAQQKVNLTNKIAQVTEAIKNIEAKIADYKAKLDGKNTEPKA